MAEKRKRKSRWANPTGVSGVTSNPKGEGNGNAKLTMQQVFVIKRYLADGVTARSLAERYGVSRSTIGLIKNGKIWQEVSDVP